MFQKQFRRWCWNQLIAVGTGGQEESVAIGTIQMVLVSWLIIYNIDRSGGKKNRRTVFQPGEFAFAPFFALRGYEAVCLTIIVCTDNRNWVCTCSRADKCHWRVEPFIFFVEIDFMPACSSIGGRINYIILGESANCSIPECWNIVLCQADCLTGTKQ